MYVATCLFFRGRRMWYVWNARKHWGEFYHLFYVHIASCQTPSFVPVFFQRWSFWRSKLHCLLNSYTSRRAHPQLRYRSQHKPAVPPHFFEQCRFHSSQCSPLLCNLRIVCQKTLPRHNRPKSTFSKETATNKLTVRFNQTMKSCYTSDATWWPNFQLMQMAFT